MAENIGQESKQKGGFENREPRQSGRPSRRDSDERNIGGRGMEKKEGRYDYPNKEVGDKEIAGQGGGAEKTKRSGTDAGREEKEGFGRTESNTSGRRMDEDLED